MGKTLKTIKTFILMFFVIMVPFSFIQVSTEASVGVKVGQWAKYSITANWTSENPNANMPTDWRDRKNMEWETVTVQKTSGTNITILVTTFFINGTQKTVTYWGDITTNRGSEEFAFQIILAGLDQGDVVRQTQISINYTTVKEFAGQNREVDYASISIKTEGITTYEYYWDKETGILCASLMTDTFTQQGNLTNTFFQKKIKETNIWQAQTGPKSETPQAWTQWGPPLVIATIAIVVVLLIKTRLMTKRTRRKRI